MSRKSVQELTYEVAHARRQPWTGTALSNTGTNSFAERKIDIRPLKNRCLDNWEIARLLTPNRSYEKRTWVMIETPTISKYQLQEGRS